MKPQAIITLFLLNLFVNVYAQQNFCSILMNGNFSSKDYSKTEPFTSSNIKHWTASHGVPTLNFNNPLSELASPEIVADNTSFLTNVGSGIKTESKIKFISGKKYYIVFNYRNNNPATEPTLKLALVTDASWGTVGNTLPLTGLTGLHYIGSLTVNKTQNNWTKKVICFTAPANSADLWFYLMADGTGISKVGIDDIEIYMDYDFASISKVLHTCDSVTHLGMKIESPCSPLNSLPTYKWFTTTNNTIIANSAALDVSPLTTTTYIVERNNEGCISYDTVKVIPSNKPRFILPKDTMICQCGTYSIMPQFLDSTSNLEYMWENGSTTIPRIVSNLSGFGNSLFKEYTLIVTNKLSGCTTTKSMIVTYSPVPNCNQRNLSVCENELPQNITTKGKGTSYSWSWTAAIAPNLPYNQKSISINSYGKYICTVIDNNANCVVGYDTINVIPFDSVKLKIYVSQYNPCDPTVVVMYNQFNPDMELKWIIDGVFYKNTSYLTASANGIYIAEYASPAGGCVIRDTVQLQFLIPPIVYLPKIYGSFCKKDCDTLLTVLYCDTCESFMGKVIDIAWSGQGVSSRKDLNGEMKFYYCAKNSKCGNNILTATVTYTRYGITCSRKYYTNTYRVCPLDLDSVPPLCANSQPVFLYNQGSTISNAQIYGNGVYIDSVSGFYKFNPAVCGPGIHNISYYYSDNAGCSSWDSLKVYVYGSTKISLQTIGTNFCNPKLKIQGYNSENYYTGSYHITSNFIGNYSIVAGKDSFIIDTIKNIEPEILYWVKITNDYGCSVYESYTHHNKNNFSLSIDSSYCLTEGIPISYSYNGNLITSVTHPSTLAYSWDDIPVSFISTNILDSDSAYSSLKSTIALSKEFSGCPKKVSKEAKYIVYTPGWHKIRVITLGGCEFTDSIFVSFDCKTCNNISNHDIYITQPLEIWNDEFKIITGNVYILPGSNLEINHCTVYFSPCSKIVVQNTTGTNSSISRKAATLTITNNSLLSACSSWKGIEVWGVEDVYNWNGVNILLGRDPRTELKGFQVSAANGLPNTTHSWAWVYVKNSSIQNAEIAIFSGMYNENDPSYYSSRFTGGLVFVDGSSFSNNFIDIVFTPRPGVAMNTTPTTKSWNASYITRSVFKANKNKADCDTMSWFGINGSTTTNGKIISNVNTKGHIIDLTETQNIVVDSNIYPHTKFYYYNNNGFYPLEFGISCQHTSTLKRDNRVPFTIWNSLYEFDIQCNNFNKKLNPVTDRILLESYLNQLSTNPNNW